MQSGRARVKGQWITLNKTGTPDLLAVLPGGRCLAIETKQLGETASIEQKATVELLNALGAIAVVLDHYDEEELDDLLQEAWEN